MTTSIAGRAWAFVLLAVACGSDADTFDPGFGRTDAGARPGADGGAGQANDASAAFVDAGLPPDVGGDVNAVVTADNAFSFGYGDETSIGTYVPGGPASNGSEIFDCPVGFGPHAFVVPAKDAPASAFLYIVAWADTKTTQGVLAQFKRGAGAVVYSGSGSWQVCATGKFIDPDVEPGPNQATANQNIVACNAGASGDSYSKGWVNITGAITAGAIGKLAFGEANDDPGGSFPIVCQVDNAGVHGIDAPAKWMWFDPLDGITPFEGNDGNRTKSWLIFRLPASALSVK
jgi:hypothetical protein